MRWSVRRKSVVFIVLGCVGVGGAVALNIGWVIVSWREAGLLVAGLVLFPLIIAGVVLNTIFLVREIRRNEQHENFLNAVTHELKTPVASIRLYLETLQRHELDPARRQEFYRVMLDDSDRLLRQIEQVLRAARTPRQKLLHRVPVDVRALAADCLEAARLRHHLPDGALRYAEALPAGSRTVVLGDADELKAAVSNLLDNAVKYSGVNVRVLLELVVSDPFWVTVRVRDEGLGISPTELKRIFRRFYRIPGVAAARIKGSGLGLFIVQATARKHGGRVFAHSDGPGRGSTFTLQLPVAPAPVPSS